MVNTYIVVDQLLIGCGRYDVLSPSGEGVLLSVHEFVDLVSPTSGPSATQACVDIAPGGFWLAACVVLRDSQQLCVVWLDGSTFALLPVSFIGREVFHFRLVSVNIFRKRNSGPGV